MASSTLARIDPTRLPRNLAGVPLPPSEIAKRVRQVHDALGLRYLSASWAITWAWPVNDRRWELVKAGETPVDFAFDIIGYLPIECSVDEAPAYLERCLKSYPLAEIQALSFRIAHYNHDEPIKQAVDTVVNATKDAMGKADEVTTAIFAVTPAKKAKGPKKKMENTL